MVEQAERDRKAGVFGLTTMGSLVDDPIITNSYIYSQHIMLTIKY
jgi:hypothetical protein